jgi:hypothetical protein
VLKLFCYMCNLLMSIVEDRRHVDVPSYSVKFDSSYGLIHLLSWGLMHLFMSTHPLSSQCEVKVRAE